MSRSTSRFSKAMVAGALALSLAACGGSPTAGGAASSGGDAATDAESTYAKFSDMAAGTERHDAIVEQCKEEGSLVVNSAASVVPDLLPAFEDEFDIKTEFVEPTSSESQRQRILQEHQAGRVSADVLVTYTSDLAHVYSVEGVTAKYTSPVTAELDSADLQSENFISIYQYPVVPQYNTDLVPESERPQSYADLAKPEWKGKVGLVRGDGNWYFTLFDYMTTEGGMSVDEFEEVFTGIADNSRTFDGHGSASLVAAGEVPLLLNGFQLFTLSLEEEGAPISSEPYLEPVGMIQFGAGMTTTAQHPACAVLFSEWLIQDGQNQIVDSNYYPVNLDALDADLPFSVEDHELAYIPIDSIDSEEFAAWETAFDNLVSGKGEVLPEFVR